MTVDPNVAGSLAREQAYLAEAKASPACADLASMLVARVEKLEELVEQEAEAAHSLDATEREYEQARVAFNRADLVLVAGSLEPKQALKNHEAHVVATARLRALGAPLAAAKSQLVALRSKITKRDTAREAAQETTKAGMLMCLRGRPESFRLDLAANATPEERAWWPWAESRCLAEWNEAAKAPEYARQSSDGVTSSSYGPPDRSTLESLFRARRAAVDGARRKLQNDLDRLGGRLTAQL